MHITYRYYRLPNTIKKAKLSEKQVKKLAITTAQVLGKFINPRGGVTEARLHIDDGTVLTARVTCSYQDNFCKKTGRQLALRKLLRAARALYIDDYAFVELAIEAEIAAAED